MNKKSDISVEILSESTQLKPVEGKKKLPTPSFSKNLTRPPFRKPESKPKASRNSPLKSPENITLGNKAQLTQLPVPDSQDISELKQENEDMKKLLN